MLYRTFNWVGGAGGSWLLHLIFLLERNSTDLSLNTRIHYHSAEKSREFQKKLPSPPDHTPDLISGYFYNGYCKFNFYLNCMAKYNIHDHHLDQKPLNEKIENFSNGAYYIISYPIAVDLDFVDLYKNPNRFVDNLFLLLDYLDISYSKNRDLCLIKIEEFLSTCLDPRQFIFNWDNDVWLGWAIGILRYKKIKLDFSIDNVKDRNFLVKKIREHEHIVNEFSKTLVLYENPKKTPT